MNDLLLKMAAAAAISGTVTMLAVPAVKRLAERFGAVRKPRERDVHQTAMPLWGGLAMFFGFMLAVLTLRLWTGQEMSVAVGRGQHPILGILLGATIIAIVGLLDDVKDLKPSHQTMAMLGGGLVAALLGARVEGITNPFTPLPSDQHAYSAQNWIELPLWLSLTVTVVWVFLVAKTFDFLDGLDGLAAGVCAIAATTMGLMAAAGGRPDSAVAVLAAALAGA
jgi:UDP-GlcNAc:undecaprenyl-phosphate GlcNAc-1-phosphate transferase